jgi:hypothetical protein
MSGEPPRYSINIIGITATATSTFYLEGQIKHLGKDNSLPVVNNSEDENRLLFSQYLLSGQGLHGPEAVFVPKVLFFKSRLMVED